MLKAPGQTGKVGLGLGVPLHTFNTQPLPAAGKGGRSAAETPAGRSVGSAGHTADIQLVT